MATLGVPPCIRMLPSPFVLSQPIGRLTEVALGSAFKRIAKCCATYMMQVVQLN